jgi:hypothetical protein
VGLQTPPEAIDQQAAARAGQKAREGILEAVALRPHPTQLARVRRMVLEGLRLADQVAFALHIVIGISEQAILISFCVHFLNLVLFRVEGCDCAVCSK